jgi:hypothetical protein
VAVPTIGIGGSPACDGQIPVIDDMLGLFTEFTPNTSESLPIPMIAPAPAESRVRTGLGSMESRAEAGHGKTVRYRPVTAHEPLGEMALARGRLFPARASALRTYDASQKTKIAIRCYRL